MYPTVVEKSYNPILDLISIKSAKIDPKNLIQENKLGEGNFGVVYKGTYTLDDELLEGDGLKIPVAIKELKVDTKENKQGIIKEAALMTKLNHANIIRHFFTNIISPKFNLIKLFLYFFFS